MNTLLGCCGQSVNAMREIGQEFLKKLSGVQLYGLSVWESGFRNLTNSVHPVNSLADVKGLKIRTMENKIHIAFWKEMGADATPMSWGEAYTALQQGAYTAVRKIPR